MTENLSPFDHRPDPVLGTALRRALEPGEHQTFVARVRAATAATQPGSAGVATFDLLAAWAARGIAAAAAVALLAGFLVVRSLDAPAGVEEAFASVTEAEGTTALLAGQRPPDASVVFATMVEH